MPERLNPSRLSDRADELLRGLHRQIVGQDDAIHRIVEAYEAQMAGMNDQTRPVGSFLFLGPSGTGKTRTVEATAENLLKNERAVVKIDCAEYRHSHEIARLTGAPAGYLGHRETTPLLNQQVLDLYHTDKVKISFVLFDEIEKASDALWNLLLGILDKATLTLGSNSRVSFSRCMVFMTANVGSRQISEVLESRFGFTAGKAATNAAKRICNSGMEAAKSKFSPEFLNRIDQIVVFQPLSDESLRQILSIEIQKVQDRIMGTPNPFILRLTEAAKAYLLREGTSSKYGARELRRVIEKQVVRPLSSIISSGQLRTGMGVQVGYEGDELVFDGEDVAVGVTA